MKRPTIIDIEASGFGKGSYPIEIGYANEHGQTWCSLITPDEDCVHWDAKAEQLHQISREILLQHGKPATMIAKHLNTQNRHKIACSSNTYNAIIAIRNILQTR